VVALDSAWSRAGWLHPRDACGRPRIMKGRAWRDAALS
jgi:hypothetical protein